MISFAGEADNKLEDRFENIDEEAENVDEPERKTVEEKTFESFPGSERAIDALEHGIRGEIW